MQSRGRLAWMPAFLIGFVAATSAELAGGLLLYSDEGFLRALSLLLSVELGGLALGLWASRPGRRQDPFAAVRRRWLFCLVAYTAAAGFTAAWQMSDGLPSTFLNQGLGLALLGGLPLYAAGSVLGALGSLERRRGRRGPGDGPASERPGSLGAVASLGGAMGVLATGLVLIPTIQPVSIFLLCVVLVSAAALLHGWILEGREPGAGEADAGEPGADSATGGDGTPGRAGSSPPPVRGGRER